MQCIFVVNIYGSLCVVDVLSVVQLCSFGSIGCAAVLLSILRVVVNYFTHGPVDKVSLLLLFTIFHTRYLCNVLR
jgi:hypothetical protein